MKIGIIGGGMVGRATARCFMENHEIRVYDKVPERSTHNLHEVMCESEIIFVCLPTPAGPKGQADLTYLEKFFAHCGRLLHDKNFVLKSTVPIGTTKRLAAKYNLTNLVHSPEFLTARCSLVDAQTPARNIVGCTPGNQVGEVIVCPDGTFINTPHYICPRILQRLYRGRFPGVPIHTMTSDESEAVKLFTNGFFSVKLAYFNEIYSLVSKLGLDWEAVRAGMLSDGRITHSHTQVPGPDDKLGFGGACLPKDLNNLIHNFYDKGISPHACQAALEYAREGEV